jgi:hypothetical protein
MRVSAGYKQDTGASLIIVGEVQHVVHQRSGPEWVTNLDINDGAVEMRENRISKSFAPGTDAATAVQQLAAAVCPGVDLYASPRGKLEKGFAFSGPAKMALDQICRRFDLEWSVQNNRVQIIPLGGSAAPKVYSLSAASGLIGNPERINYSLGKLKEAKKTEPTWKIRTLLMPALTPAGIVKVDSIDLKGQFTIDNVRHQGDTFGRPWDTEIEIQ